MVSASQHRVSKPLWRVLPNSNVSPYLTPHSSAKSVVAVDWKLIERSIDVRIPPGVYLFPFRSFKPALVAITHATKDLHNLHKSNLWQSTDSKRISQLDHNTVQRKISETSYTLWCWYSLKKLTKVVQLSPYRYAMYIVFMHGQWDIHSR